MALTLIPERTHICASCPGWTGRSCSGVCSHLPSSEAHICWALSYKCLAPRLGRNVAAVLKGFVEDRHLVDTAVKEEGEKRAFTQKPLTSSHKQSGWAFCNQSTEEMSQVRAGCLPILSSSPNCHSPPPGHRRPSAPTATSSSSAAAHSGGRASKGSRPSCSWREPSLRSRGQPGCQRTRNSSIWSQTENHSGRNDDASSPGETPVVQQAAESLLLVLE